MTNLCLSLGIEELSMDFNEKSLRLVRAASAWSRFQNP